MQEPTVTNVSLAPLRRQEAAAFEQLVADHQQMVLGLAQSLGLRGACLDDGAAEVFANVYRSLPRFEGRSALSTWVYQIAFRTLCRLRARSPRPVKCLSDEIRDRNRMTPVQEALSKERNQLIWEAVAKLEPRQAMVIELYYRRDWAVEKIAVVMLCPVGTVKTLLARARQQLRQHLERKHIEQ